MPRMRPFPEQLATWRAVCQGHLHTPMAPHRTVQEPGVGGQAAEVVPLLHGQLIADESLALDEDDAPQSLPLLPALKPGEVRGRPAAAAFGPTVPLGPFPVVANAVPLPPV